MKKFPYKTAEKHQALGFVLLGIILLVGLISPAFAGASIIVTGSGPVGEDPNDNWGIIVTGTEPVGEDPDDNWGIIVTGTNPVSTTTTIPYPTYTSHYDSSSTPLVVTSHPPCHGSSCTTTITNPSLSIVSHPPCHDPSCTTTTTNPPCTTTTTCPNTIRYTCNSNYQCVTASNGEFTSLNSCQSNCVTPTRYACNTNTYQCYVATNGVYANLNDCVNDCQPLVTRYTCNSNYQCVTASNGEYTSLNGCQSNCVTPTRYACNTNTYQCYQTTSGPYTSYNNCTNACQAPITRYTCNSNYQCVIDNYGPYTSLNSCQNNCISQTRYACNTNTYQCYQTTSGPYTSYNNCTNACQQTNQSLSVSCNSSPNPAQINKTVTFSSNVSGGSGDYSYSWSGATYGNNSYTQKSFSSYGNYTVYLTVHDSQNRSASTSCSVNVNEQYTNTPTLNLWADKYTITQEESTYLRWSSTNASYCTASNGWSGSKSTSGYESVSPNSDTTYSLTCYGNGGQITRSATIYVTSVGTSLNLTKLGRNLSAGNRVYSKVIRVAENDVIEFYLTITAGSNKDLYNVNIKDILPSVLSYMPGTTKINGIVQPDTITTTGLQLETLYKGAAKTVVFQALSNSPGTYLTFTNTAEVTADNENKITDSASVTYGLVAGAATIRTGPLDTLLISFIISLLSSLIIWYYLRFNPKGQLALVRTESRIRDIWLAYTRNRIMRQN